MTELRQLEKVPEWDVADRMRKAIRDAGLGVQDMATYLGVTRHTVSTWINGRIRPSTQTLRLWAIKTGVPYTWLCHDDNEGCRPPRSMRGSAFSVASLVAA